MRHGTQWDATLRETPPAQWATLLDQNSGLPGPRANLELVATLAPLADLPMIETIIVEVPNPGHPYGVRGVGDYEYEKQMAVMNRHLAPQVDTIFLAPSPEFAHISSTLVREIAFLDGRISGLVPSIVADKLHEKTGG